MRIKRTKIVATIGPATSDKETLSRMIDEGMNVARMNFSHGAHSDHEKVVEILREIDQEKGTHTAILADLQGPKIRIGDVENNGVALVNGENINIVCKEILGTAEAVGTNYSSFAKDVEAGEKVLLDDGKLMLEVIETNNEDTVKCKIIHGGVLSSKKGVNLPNTKLSLPCLTKKDLIDLDFAIEQNVDWIGLSFVRFKEDIIELKRIIKESQKSIKIVAKIEKPEAIKDIDGIIEESDALMVARGDLGVEIPMQNVPLIQKMLIKKSNAKAKPVIVATQMMESMIENISPTRAEVNDVANAVLDGADAVMLSGETSVGKFPVEVIQAMTKIIQQMEKSDGMYYHEAPPGDTSRERFVTDAICYNACRLAFRSQAAAIVTMTFSGYTAFKISSQKPKSIIYVFTANKKILSMLSLVWGVYGFYYDKMVSTDSTISDIIHKLKSEGEVNEGDFVINIASMPIMEQGMSNMIKLSKV